MRFRDMPTQILQECPFDGLIFGAGFEHFRVHDFEDPANLYYEVRP